MTSRIGASQPKRLSRNEIRDRTVRFAHDWSTETSERAEAQTFWAELLDCFGVNRRRAGVMFERSAKRASTGNQGRIDVFFPGLLLAEHKSAGKLIPSRDPLGQSEAERQAFDYLSGGDITDSEFPRYVMTSDFRSLQLTDLEAPIESPDRTATFLTIDLPDHFEKLLFLANGHAPQALGDKTDELEASQEAVILMGALYEAMVGDIDTGEIEDADDEDDITERASVLLTRLLFLMAGDDNGLWAHDLFGNFIRDRTAVDGSDLGAQLQALFQVLNTSEKRRSANLDLDLAEFPYINGGIFGETMPVEFANKAFRDALLACCDFRWNRISPAIFGSLFQTIKSREARHGDGEHYTSETNILRTIGPLFLDDLRSRLDRTNTVRGLRAFWQELGDYRFLDPACGCGNFLVVAYREMRQLELDLIVKLRALQGTSSILALDATADLKIRLDQFYGIEINWWPAKIAETAMFLVDHQANRRMETELGLSPQRLPINIEATIHHGNALRTDWDEVCPGGEGPVYVFGNPPFVGHEDRTAEQNADMRAAWGRSDLSRLDYVTSWHARTVDYYGAKRPGAWAFVATNSITQGDQPARLFTRVFGAGWRIKFGHRSFFWFNESRAKDTAAVHVVIVGFTRDKVKGRLFSYPDVKGDPIELRVSEGVNAYLVDGTTTLLVSKANSPISPSLSEVAFGKMPRDGGGLVVKADVYPEFNADPVARKYLRRYVGSEELINSKDRWCLWLEDMDPADIGRSVLLKDRIEYVRAFRAKSGAESTRTYPHPHLFVQMGTKHTEPYLILPRVVSENRRYFTAGWVSADVIASDAVFTADDPDGFLFSVVSSSMFITWQKTIGGRLESRIRFAKTLTWNTFPLPEVAPDQRERIIAAGKGVLDARDLYPDRTLAEHYEPLAMAPTLVAAHDKLDSLVDRAFGMTRRCTSETERQSILFDQYAALTSGLAEPVVSKRGRKRKKIL